MWTGRVNDGTGWYGLLHRWAGFKALDPFVSAIHVLYYLVNHFKDCKPEFASDVGLKS
jgi:hypothetical protein